MRIERKGFRERDGHSHSISGRNASCALPAPAHSRERTSRFVDKLVAGDGDTCVLFRAVNFDSNLVSARAQNLDW